MHETERHHFLAAVSSPDEHIEPPWVMADAWQLDDDKAVFARVVAVFLAPAVTNGDAEPWLVRAALRLDAHQHPTISRIGVEHLTNPDREVTGVILKRVPAPTIRNRALAYLLQREKTLDVMKKAGVELPQGWYESASHVATLARSELKRGPKGYPREHYRRIALRCIELHRQGVRNVLRVLADEEGVPYETARTWRDVARRKYRYLAPSPRQGQAWFEPGPNLYEEES
jgi:hypothetical protein